MKENNKNFSYYSKGANQHYDICQTYEINSNFYNENISSEHPHLEINFILDNCSTMRCRNKNYQIKPNTFMLFNGLEKHTEIFKNKSNLKNYAITIPYEYISSVVKPLNIKANEITFDNLLHITDPEIKRLLLEIFSSRTTPNTSKISFDCPITELLVYVFTRFENSHSAKISRVISSAHFPSHISKAKRIIYNNIYNEDLNLDNLSSQLGMSKFHFIRTFKRSTGLTPMKYLNKLKVDFANKKILSTPSSIINIAYDLGFKDISTFNKLYKKNTSISPTTYKKRYLKSAIIS